MALTATLDPVGHDVYALGKASRFMRLGLFVSILLHLGLLAWAAISISTAKPPVTPDEVPVEVSLLTKADLANLRKGSESAKTATTAALPKEADPTDIPPVKAKRVATPPPTATPEPMPPEPKAEAKPDPTPPEPKPEPKLVAKADPVPPEPKPDAKTADPIADILKKTAADPPVKKDPPKKVATKEDAVPPEPLVRTSKTKTLDFNKLQAQINQLPDAAPQAGSDQTPDPAAKTKAPAAGIAHPTGTQLSATEQMMFSSIFNRKVQGCWTVLAGAADAQDLVVPVSFDLAPDGSLLSPPTVSGGGGSPSFALAAENVVRAITQCAPYQMPGDYAKWKHWDYTFDPRAMFGG